MRIVFDAYWWVDGPTSLRHVLRETVLTWHERFPADRIALVVRAQHAERARAEVPPGLAVVPTRVRPQALLASLATERTRRRLGFDVTFAQNFAARSRGLSAVYLHDVLFETNPEWFTRTERRYFALMTRWAGRADVVFSSSATEGARIREHTPARHVVPVGLGLSEELVGRTAETRPDGLRPDGFLLTVGRLNRRKNLERTILGALESGAATPENPLIVVGAGSRLPESLDPTATDAVRAGSVRFAGHVGDDELRWLYRNTSLFLFLSLGEGFGMPPIEARAFDAPVLVADLPVMRENLGSEGAYVDPEDVVAIGKAITDALAAPRPAATALRDTHSWVRTVTAIRAELQHLLDRSST